MYTKQDITKQLDSLDAPRDKIVVMHTSYRKVGDFEGGPAAFLDTLIEYFTSEGGLFCIPTHTWSSLGRTDVEYTLDMQSNETCVGTLPNIAAAHPKGHRSIHPTHSMMVFGDDARAEEFIFGEENIDTSTSPDGCYGKIYKRGGYILLVGVAHGNNTFLHSAEEILDLPGRLSVNTVDTTIRLPDGTVTTRNRKDEAETLSIADAVAKFRKEIDEKVR